jgi:hypothetical protein
LFYLAPDQTLLAVAVAAGEKFKAETPAALFRARFERMTPFGSAYSATADGQRFLVNEVMSEDDVRLDVRMNWTPDQR